MTNVSVAPTATDRVASLPRRPAWVGMRQLLVYNWPTYAMATAAAVAVGGLAVWMPLPGWFSLLLLTGAAATLAGEAASLAVANVVYDRSRLHRWDWLAQQVPTAQSWAVVHAGIDESSAALRHLYPEADGTVLDIFDPAAMTEPGIRIARSLQRDRLGTAARPDALPLASGSQDLVLLLFAAHEMRTRQGRDALACELRRVSAPEGTIVVVEHLRDVPNAAAFGPGALHFHSRREWLRVFAGAGLAAKAELSITPFVRAWFLGRTATKPADAQAGTRSAAWRRQLVWGIRLASAGIWIAFGLFAKVLGMVPRHEAIVSEVIGPTWAGPATIAVGLGECGLAVWVLTGFRPRLCMAAQTAAIAAMNTLELLHASALLLAPVPMVLANAVFLGAGWWAAVQGGRPQTR